MSQEDTKVSAPGSDVGFDPMKAIMDERERQKTMWSTNHDDIQEEDGKLARAACCYALAAVPVDFDANILWPWPGTPLPVRDDDRKGSRDRMSLLAKAGALVVAEMERLSRLG